MIKKRFQGANGFITTYKFKLMGKRIMIAVSESKWKTREGNSKKPIWLADIAEGIPALFIWNVAFSMDMRN